jgi:hypothetical protein
MLHVELSVNTNQPATLNSRSEHYSPSAKPHTFYKWNETKAEASKLAIRDNITDLREAVANYDLNNTDGIENCVKNFISRITNIAGNFHRCKNSEYTKSKKVKVNENKPWFDDQCNRLFKRYKQALQNFNKSKSSSNHKKFIECKRSYKILVSRSKLKYLRLEGNMLTHIKNKNPKLFHAKFSKKKTKISNNLALEDFQKYFQNLMGCNQAADTASIDHPCDEIYPELNATITDNEVSKAIKKLKRGKSHGNDGLLNEYFIEFPELTPLLVTIFNAMLKTSYVPKIISHSLIIPIYKKGDVNIPANYRGISLISNFTKLFTSILNNRLLSWSEKNKIIKNSQFGFRPKLGTIDANFVLNCVIQKHLSAKHRLYCCFIDYEKAFDAINRDLLWSKIAKLGIRGNMLYTIQNLYKNVRSSILLNGLISESFCNNSGVLQGEVLSPILFSLFVNDCDSELIKGIVNPVSVNGKNIPLLLYADDMVMMANNINDLQQMLNNLKEYTSNWSLTVNVSKTKMLIFRNGGHVNNDEKFFYNGKKVDIVSEFSYLGLLLKYNGKFYATQKQLAVQGRKANFKLKANCNGLQLNHATMLYLFETYIKSILDYGCEIWGSHAGPDIEKVHLDFCKHLLGVKKTTPNSMVYHELGRHQLSNMRWLKIFKYWTKVLRTQNDLLNACYQQMYSECENRLNCSNWLSSVKKKMFQLGLGNWWVNQNECNLDHFLSKCKTRITDVSLQTMKASFSSSKFLIYKNIITQDHSIQNYLLTTIPLKFKKVLSRFRLVSHNLNIEYGRFTKTQHSHRTCFHCPGIIEDEYHFVLECPLYKDDRNVYIKKFYTRKPSTIKLCKLLNSRNHKELINLAKFLSSAFKTRSNQMS